MKERIHFVGIGGVGMGTLAVALAESGYEVTGSDTALYEPMKGVLERAGIKATEGYRAETAEGNPDVVVIGNVVRRDNPEAAAWIRKGADFVSFPEAVRRLLIRDRKSIVVAGTHGKTTTTTWIAFLMKELGKEPAYLIGGVPRELPRGCELGSGDVFVGEGDEYDSAFFDKGPKFLHYNPHFLVLNNIEFDHADIYRDLDHVKSSFSKLVALLPGDGLCVANYDDENVMDVVTASLCPVQTFGRGPGAMWRLKDVKESPEGYHFEVAYKGRSLGEFHTPLMGAHNLRNLLTGIICAVNMGVNVDLVRPIVPKFRGPRRRQEVILTEPVTLIDDFAHHPTEVAATLKSVRDRYPGARVWAFFEPRSATARTNTHQAEYPAAFQWADEVLLGLPIRQDELAEDKRFSPEALVKAIRDTGKNAESYQSVEDMVARFSSSHQPGDVAVVMSNGEFGKIQEKLKKVFS